MRGTIKRSKDTKRVKISDVIAGGRSYGMVLVMAFDSKEKVIEMLSREQIGPIASSPRTPSSFGRSGARQGRVEGSGLEQPV